MNDLQQMHDDLMLEAMRLEEIVEASKHRTLTNEEVMELLAALGLMRRKG